MAQFIRPTPNTAIRSEALAPWNGQMSVAAWYDNDAWSGVSGATTLLQTPLSGSNLITFLVTDSDEFLITQTGAFIVTSDGNPQGYCGAVPDGASGAWYCAHYGQLVNMASGGGLTMIQIPADRVFEGIAYSQVSGKPYMAAADGSLWTTAGTGAAVAVGHGYGATVAKGLSVSGNVLFSALPVKGGFGTYNLASNVSGIVTNAITKPAGVAASTAFSGWVGFGWSNAVIGSGFVDLSPDPVIDTNLIGVNSSGQVSLWVADVSGNWTFHASVTGIGTPSHIKWAPNGVTIFASDTANNDVKVIDYSVGSLSVLQALSITGAGQSSFTPTATRALVCQPASNQLSDVEFTSSWAVSGTVAVGNPQSVLITSANQALVGGSSGVTTLAFGGGHWTVVGSVALPFVPNALFEDPSGIIYAAGTSGGSGYLSLVSSGVVAYSTSWAGSASGLVWVQGQPTVADPFNNIVRVFGITASGLSQQGSAAGPTGTTTIAFQDATLFVAGASQTLEYNYTAPYTIRAVRDGMVYVEGPGSNGIANLGIGHQPTAAAFDSSGHVNVATLQNDLYTISLSGAILVHGAITQFGDMPQSVPIGISRLHWFNGNLYGSTSLNDSLVMIL